MAEWETDDLMTQALMDQKGVTVVGSATALTNEYDGQFWVDQSSDPPVVRVYDERIVNGLSIIPSTMRP